MKTCPDFKGLEQAIFLSPIRYYSPTSRFKILMGRDH